MPYQPINFAGIDPMGHPSLRNIVQEISGGLELSKLPEHLKQRAEEERLGNLMRGLQAQYLPQQMEQQAEKERIGNQMSMLQMQYLPQEIRSQIALRQAQAAQAQQTGAQKQMLTNLLRQAMQGGGNGGLSSPMGADTNSSELAQAYLRRLITGSSSELPSQQQQRALDTFRQKEQFSSAQPTATTKSRLDRLEDVGVPLFEGLEEVLKKGRTDASFGKRIESLGESFGVAKNYPKGEGSMQMAIDVLKPSARENILDAIGQNRYQTRIKNEMSKIAPSIAEAYKRKNQPVPEVIQKYMKNNDAADGATITNTVIIEDPSTGKRHRIPSNLVNDALKAGGRRVNF